MEKLESQKAKGFFGQIWGYSPITSIQVDEQLIKTIIPFWHPSYRCFTFNQEDMTPTIEEYTSLLKIVTSNPNKIFGKKAKGVGFIKKMSQIMGIDAKVISQVKSQKGKGECLTWDFVKKFLAKYEEHVFNIFVMAMYEMVIFPKVPNHIEAALVDLVEHVNSQVDPLSAIFAKTIRSLNFCRKKGKGQFIGCVQLLYIWIRSHF